MELKDKIREFITRNLTVFNDEIEFSDTDNIFQLGLVNSLYVMKLLHYVESEFDIVIENEDMDIRYFSSVDNIARLITRKTATV
jgi:methoxymalonate biosynthesis acyl carrier protein